MPASSLYHLRKPPQNEVSHDDGDLTSGDMSEELTCPSVNALEGANKEQKQQQHQEVEEEQDERNSNIDNEVDNNSWDSGEHYKNSTD
jgi:hypothetical protein